MARCIVGIREMKSPIMGDPRGWRIIAALPNMAGTGFHGPVPSFDKPYYIAHFGDYVSPVDVTDHLASIGRTLKKLGFETIVDLIIPSSFTIGEQE